jgi:alpha-D-ribose 1-methylphosphonate 5-triphosphate synthase subunit PhnH
MQTQALEGGFADVAVDSAQAFRAAMVALARPGRLSEVTGAAPPAPLSPAAGALVLTLCDPDTAVHLAGAHDCAQVRDWITFHAGAPLTEAARADFAIGTWPALQPLEAYATGSAEYPDRSATLIVEVDRLAAEGAVLRGPGIDGTARLSLPETAAFRANAGRFPLGLDFFFSCGNRLAALPRTTQVEDS